MINKKIVHQLILSTQLNELHGAIEIIENAVGKVQSHKRSTYYPIVKELLKKKGKADEKLTELKETSKRDWEIIYDEARSVKEDLRMEILKAANEIQSTI